MAAYTVTKEIKFGHRVDVRVLGALIPDPGSSLLLELKIKDGVYVRLQEWTSSNSQNGQPGGHHGMELTTRGATYRFTVIGDVDWWVDESRLD